MMAVSMERLPMSGARLSAFPIAMTPLDPVVRLEVPPAVATAPPLLGEPPRQAWLGVGMPSHYGGGDARRPGLAAQWQRPDECKPTPGPLAAPSPGCVWMALLCPGPELCPHQIIQPPVD